MFLKSLLTAFTLSAWLVSANPVNNFPNTCDNDMTGTLSWNALAAPVQHSPNDLVKMTGKPGYGACNRYYQPTSHVACMKSGWSTDSSIPMNGCGRWIRVQNTENGAKTDAQILDVCPGEPKKLDCEDLYLSPRAFDEVAGSSHQASENAGHLINKIKWQFQVAPCWTCYAGLFSQTPDGKVDDCTGRDGDGFMRCGPKSGKDRILGADVLNVCNKDYVCPN